MRLFGKRVGELTEADLRRLVTSQAGETRTLEFKSSWVGTSDEARREFLADISCMANTDGGVLLFGIATQRDVAGADTGLAGSFAPLGIVSWETERLRILNMAHDGLSPSLSSALEVSSIQVATPGDLVVAIGIPRSIAGPHMVSFQKRNQFFRRNEGGKYQPGVEEIRRMFLQGQTWLEQAESFRDARLAALRNGRIAQFSSVAPAAVVHVLPLGRLSELLDLQTKSAALAGKLEPLNPDGHSGHYNADGYLRYTRSAEFGEEISGYAQCFRFGGLEGGMAPIGRDIGSGGTQRLLLWGTHTQQACLRFVQRSLELLSQDLETEGPYGILFSFLRIRGYRVIEDPGGRTGRPIETEDALIPLISVPGATVDYAALAPAFDVLWQCSGLPGAPPVQATP